MKKLLNLFLALFLTLNLFAQMGSITPEILNEIRSSVKLTKTEIAIQNGLANEAVSKLALNPVQGKKEDHFFKYEVEVKGITNQKRSGRCWLFASLNVFRPVVIEKYNLDNFEFSQNYLYFWHIFEQSNLFLENVIATADKDIYDREVYMLFRSPVGDGGAWNDFVNLVEKYGAVPKDVMPETYQSENTSKMVSLINEKLREDGLILRDAVNSGKSRKQLEKTKIEMLKDIYKILVLSLGEPPTEFQWRYKNKDGEISEYKTYTPQSFWNEAVNANLSDYVMFVDDPTRPYYKYYEREKERNTYEGINWTYVNMPTGELKKFALASLKDGSPMYFSCDVGKFFNRDAGTLDLNNYDYEAVYGVKFGMNKKQRMLSQQSGSTHGMVLCGVDTDENGNPTKWKLENSWGKDNGNNGFLTMTDEWFTEYMFRLVINKKYLDEKTLKILEQKPEKVPYYNPAFQPDN